jgi:hypothetical protein
MYSRYAEVNLTFTTNNGKRELVMRQPTDAEWTKRINTRFSLVKGSDRNTKTDVVNGGSSDLVVLKAILKSEVVPELDEYESSIVVDQLVKANVVDCETSDSSHTFTLDTVGGETKHTIRIPSVKDLKQCADNSMRTTRLAFGVKFTQSYGASSEVYDKYIEHIEGYDTDPEGGTAASKDVPIPHKFALIDALYKQVMELKANIAGAEDDIFN